MNKRQRKQQGLNVALSSDAVAERMAHLRSGAAGVHDDQKTRRSGTYRTNRVGSRSSQRRAAIKDWS